MPSPAPPIEGFRIGTEENQIVHVERYDRYSGPKPAVAAD